MCHLQRPPRDLTKLLCIWSQSQATDEVNYPSSNPALVSFPKIQANYCLGIRTCRKRGNEQNAATEVKCFIKPGTCTCTTLHCITLYHSRRMVALLPLNFRPNARCHKPHFLLQLALIFHLSGVVRKNTEIMKCSNLSCLPW